VSGLLAKKLGKQSNPSPAEKDDASTETLCCQEPAVQGKKGVVDRPSASMKVRGRLVRGKKAAVRGKGRAEKSVVFKR